MKLIYIVVGLMGRDGDINVVATKQEAIAACVDEENVNVFEVDADSLPWTIDAPIFGMTDSEWWEADQ